ncbi:MAG: hypothetical protein VX034_12655, partial [Planctomycetota bacterium]|nr:hypothetical protein [Planctomycetota bacterium]
MRQVIMRRTDSMELLREAIRGGFHAFRYDSIPRLILHLETPIVRKIQPISVVLTPLLAWHEGRSLFS